MATATVAAPLPAGHCNKVAENANHKDCLVRWFLVGFWIHVDRFLVGFIFFVIYGWMCVMGIIHDEV